jgi:ribosomal protein S18 acetylase RimI-like enzyme
MFFIYLIFSLCLPGYISPACAVPHGHAFELVSGRNHPQFGVIRETFKTKIAPLYGDQEKALNKIACGCDRTCLLLTQGNEPRGLLLFKKELSNEYENLGIQNSLEVKTLCLVNLREDKGQGFGTTLLNRAKDEAQTRGASGVHLTISESLGVLGFYRGQGFCQKTIWPNKFQQGDNELLLYWRNPQGDL